MRKPRDFDAELKALSDKAKRLGTRKLLQLGELTIATGADALPIDMLAGVLLAAAQTKDAAAREVWRKNGAAFFQRTPRGTALGADGGTTSEPANSSSAQPPAADASPA